MHFFSFKKKKTPIPIHLLLHGFKLRFFIEKEDIKPSAKPLEANNNDDPNTEFEEDHQYAQTFDTNSQLFYPYTITSLGTGTKAVFVCLPPIQFHSLHLFYHCGLHSEEKERERPKNSHNHQKTETQYNKANSIT